MKVFLDMDGVLVNFSDHSLLIHGIQPETWTTWDFHHKWFPSPEEQKKFWQPMGEHFWENLPWSSEGKELFANVERLVGIENIGILTTPCDTPGSMEGKKNWVRRELPQLVKRFWPGSTKGFMGSPGHVLIDDSDHNVEGFAASGGNGILMPRPYNKGAHLVKADGTSPVSYVVERLEFYLQSEKTP